MPDKLLEEIRNLTNANADLLSTFESLGFDSLDFIELIMNIEDKYSIAISDEDARKMKTIKDVITYIQKHIS